MVIVLFGPDSYRRVAKQQELIAAYRAKHEHADLFSVDLADDPESWVKARDFLRQPSMFVDSKVLLVREPAAVEKKEWAAALADAVDAKGVIVMLSAEADPGEGLPFLKDRSVERQEFREFEGRALEAFVLCEAHTRGFTFEPSALRFFLNYLESFSSRSARVLSEFEKIALGKFTMPIARADIVALVRWLPSEEITFGTRMVGGGDSALARLSALEGLFLGGESPARLFNLIAYQVSGSVASVLALYDIAIKSGKLEYEEALTDFGISPRGDNGITRAESFLQDAM